MAAASNMTPAPHVHLKSDARGIAPRRSRGHYVGGACQSDDAPYGTSPGSTAERGRRPMDRRPEQRVAPESAARLGGRCFSHVQ